ncbi:hypothetical protein [Natrialbaceae archaeon AArc-T1-2]|uniref:hypothetical protein n=1 Tax=Natrialbaceae archaeon AArc-T1-2 TaxID=3053904 RepID=UPI00255AEF84|nr:hypothetical protein [Natrialbaceae archaeon AArc-T1-2]WIV66854.1 hypothetical protein QQ977_14345 [Natrialbaceae archaeon AArc-T1-2]
MTPLALFAVLVAITVIVGLTAFVYWDAQRLGLGRPAFWATLAGGTCAVALVTALAVPTVPRPGLLVVALAGPAVYLFERDDAKHGDEPADPHTLPTSSSSRSSSNSDSDSSEDDSAGPRTLPGTGDDTDEEDVSR